MTQSQNAVVMIILQHILQSEQTNINTILNRSSAELDCTLLHQMMLWYIDILLICRYSFLLNKSYIAVCLMTRSSRDKIIPEQSFSTFQANFRLNRPTFVTIMEYIGNSRHFQKRHEELGGRDQVVPEKMLLIVLWTLATPESYRGVGDRFGVAKSSVFQCLELITIILEELASQFIKWPTEQNKRENANKFAKYGLRRVIGAIDGCHIPIKKPRENGIDYFNRKKYYSMVLQGVCKSDMMFIDCDIRWPGSVHDGRILRTCDMFPIAQRLCGVDYYIIGDSAYPVKNWLMAPFRNNGHLHPCQIYYNKMLSKTRVVIENAFALLKGRFRRLKDYLDRDSDYAIVRTVMACCVLHNICILHNDEQIQQYIIEGRDEVRHIPMVAIMGDEQHEMVGLNRRDLITQELWDNRNNFNF